MTRLQTLKPRLATAPTGRVRVFESVSWRSEKQSSSARGYDYRWQKARDRFLASNPLCVYCECDGRVTAATVVDHIAAHRGNEELFWDQTNWQSLCAPCHSGRKQREEASQQ
ncbi:MAG TPA: HNH endonuclease signature motif containing protein [Noviherbaspirillum sp.]|jgi:5-methylcytosine-specific restriction endonuclease McrA|uniref:HNH endonuclease signature motif containing protein n=1 Tax=Noviherbaspirillum sp. TaxID=1926288 RepID=UPI002F95B32F